VLSFIDPEPFGCGSAALGNCRRRDQLIFLKQRSDVHFGRE